jgi:hypothetical protein
VRHKARPISLGMDLTVVRVERAADLDVALATIERAGADALYVFIEPMLYSNRSRLVESRPR